MRNVTVSRSIVLPPGRIGSRYCPDGLTEADVDALIAEVAGDDLPRRPRPGWLSSDEIEVRRTRRTTRQAVRALAAHWSEAGEVA
jgi:hypothetical protein